MRAATLTGKPVSIGQLPIRANFPRIPLAASANCKPFRGKTRDCKSAATAQKSSKVRNLTASFHRSFAWFLVPTANFFEPVLAPCRSLSSPKIGFSPVSGWREIILPTNVGRWPSRGRSALGNLKRIADGESGQGWRMTSPATAETAALTPAAAQLVTARPCALARCAHPAARKGWWEDHRCRSVA